MPQYTITDASGRIVRRITCPEHRLAMQLAEGETPHPGRYTDEEHEYKGGKFRKRTTPKTPAFTRPAYDDAFLTALLADLNAAGIRTDQASQLLKGKPSKG